MLNFADLTSDIVFFSAIQVGLILFGIFCAFMSWWHFDRRRHPGFSAVVKRGPNSMAMFYGAYLALTSIFVALSLAVEVAKCHPSCFCHTRYRSFGIYLPLQCMVPEQAHSLDQSCGGEGVSIT